MEKALIGFICGMFLYGTIHYFAYWIINLAHPITKKEQRLVYACIGLGWVWFIPHILIILIASIAQKVIRYFKK